MNENKVFRANARAQLGGGIFQNTWMMALLAAFLQSAILGFVNSLLCGIGGLILGGFLMFGLNRIFLQLVRGQKDKVDIGDLFCGTDYFADLLVLNLLQGLFVALWTLLFIIPGIIKSYAYSMAFYIKNDHPEYDWRQCLDESQRYMKGYKWQLFCLDFSFVGWTIVGMLCCFVGVLWVVPYQYAARANFYENLRAIYEPEVASPDSFGEFEQTAQADEPEYFNADQV
ncbi:MAG: DUF975 family protein [Ruminococcaceae bacterium]|nr:DUF975 family protein [Oscillospiraceae bacterium]